MVDASAVSALPGSAIGGLASIATTWLTHHAQDRARRQAEIIAHRRRLYEEFLEEASKTYADALTNHLEEPTRLVRLYALVGKLRLFAPEPSSLKLTKSCGPSSKPIPVQIGTSILGK